MLPEARVSHALEGRVRFRIDSRRGDAAFFEHVGHRLSAQDGIRKVSHCPATGSLLVHHDLDLPTLAQWGQEMELFRIVEAAPAPLRRELRRAAARLDREVESWSGGHLNLADAWLLLLLALTLWELAHARITAPAMTLAWYAVQTLMLAEVVAGQRKEAGAESGG